MIMITREHLVQRITFAAETDAAAVWWFGSSPGGGSLQLNRPSPSPPPVKSCTH